MELELVPLLRTQRDLYHLPRGGERFNAYLRTMDLITQPGKNSKIWPANLIPTSFLSSIVKNSKRPPRNRLEAMLKLWRKAPSSHEDLFIERYEQMLLWALQLSGYDRQQAEDPARSHTIFPSA